VKLSDWNGNTYDTKDAHGCLYKNSMGKHLVTFYFDIEIDSPVFFDSHVKAVEWCKRIRKEDHERNSNTPNP
jgi:hypothetical protein